MNLRNSLLAVTATLTVLFLATLSRADEPKQPQGSCRRGMRRAVQRRAVRLRLVLRPVLQTVRSESASVR